VSDCDDRGGDDAEQEGQDDRDSDRKSEEIES